jgi:hypothetical protein
VNVDIAVNITVYLFFIAVMEFSNKNSVPNFVPRIVLACVLLFAFR